jgi:hypothetical protein
MHLMDVAMNRDDEPSGQTGDSRTRRAMAGVSSSNPDVAGRWVRASRRICNAAFPRRWIDAPLLRQLVCHVRREM